MTSQVVPKNSALNRGCTLAPLSVYLQGGSSSVGDVVRCLQVHGTVQHRTVRFHSHPLLGTDNHARLFTCFLLSHRHWLPVTTRIQFKMALLTFKTLTTHQPSYIHDLLQPHCSSRQLRSVSHNLLETLQMRTGFAQRSFTYSASPHLEQSTSHHHWQLGRHCKHFQKETQKILLH